jgi:hypothetical protein
MKELVVAIQRKLIPDLQHWQNYLRKITNNYFKEVPKWQYRRERLLKQEEIREEIIYGSLLLLP